MKKLILFLTVVFIFNQVSYSQTWIQKMSGTGMWSLAKDLQGKIYAGASGTNKGIFRSTDGGENWETVLAASVNVLYLACDSSSGVYATYQTGGLMISTNSGDNWTNIPSSTFGGKTVQAVICGKNGYVYVGTVVGGVYRSTDGGNTFPDTTLAGLTIVSFAIDRFNSNIIYVGASSGTPPNLGFYRSTDAGTTYSGDLNPLNIWAILQKNNHNLYTVTTSTGYPFSKSTDLGLTWTNISTLNGAMRGACLDLVENIYTSGNGGVYKSTNDGVSFFSAGLTISSNQSINYQNKILVATSGTSNGGVWIYTDTTLSGISPTYSNIPDKYFLYQNYPNPFNPTTSIKYQISENSFVSLKIYDITGKELATLLNKKQSPGIYEITWDATKYPSGVYYYKLITDNFSEVKKMLLVK